MDNQLLTTTPSEQRQAFLSLQTPRDLARLLDYQYAALVYQIYKVPDEKKYELFTIPKKSGTIRTITAPNPTLKFIQRRLASVLQNVYVTKPVVYGFVEGKNIVDNARKHKKKNWVLNIDLEDFFHRSILVEYVECLWENHTTYPIPFLQFLHKFVVLITNFLKERQHHPLFPT